MDECDYTHNAVLQQRNVCIVGCSNRVVTYYHDGSTKGTRNTIEYAVKKQVETVKYVKET